MIKIHFISMGETGLAASALLQQDHYLQPGAHGKCDTRFSRLEEIDFANNAIESIVDQDIVVIIGDDTDSNQIPLATVMAKHCKQNGIRCYVLLYTVDSGTHSKELRNEAGNTLTISQEDKLAMPVVDYFVAAVCNVLHPITGDGLIGVDFDDIRAVLSCGKKTYFAQACAIGNERAVLATSQLISQLSDKNCIRSIIYNLTAGIDINMNEYSAAGDLLRENCPDDSIVIVCTTLDRDIEGIIKAGITVVT